MQKLQAFAWQSTQRGNTLHVAANPTAGELLHKEYLQKKDVLKTTSKTSILEKYGGEQYLDRLPKELLSGQSEQCELSALCPISQLTVQMSSTREREKSSKVKTSQRSDRDTTRMVRSSPVSYSDTDNQSCSTTTRQSGDPGTIENPLSGVSHVVILPVSFAHLLLKHKLIVSLRILLYRSSRSRCQLGSFHRRVTGNTRRARQDPRSRRGRTSSYQSRRT
jgi:hypothetical protein